MKHYLAALSLAFVLPTAAHAEFDRDRALDREEFLSIQAKRFDRYDASGDGELDQGEYVDGRLAAFDAADKNDDGVVTRGEARGLKGPGEAGLTREGVEAQAAATFNRVAADGVITKDAFLEKSGETFDRNDRNGDGKLTRGERRGLEKL